jgi:P pilus assembly chaperone PapD
MSVKYVLLFSFFTGNQAMAAIALDRTRVIYNAAEKSVALNINNESEKSPYLAQGWLENAEGQKITSPLTILPPIQRLEPGARSQIRIKALPSVADLAKDRETVYYFNLREIPPKSEKPNTLQFALQTRIKVFYRPEAITPTRKEMDNPWQEKLTLTRTGDSYLVHNPTPYYVTLVFAGSTPDGEAAKGFEALMLEPMSKAPLGVSALALGSKPVLTYVNDYGGSPQLMFTCTGDICTAASIKQDK